MQHVLEILFGWQIAPTSWLNVQMRAQIKGSTPDSDRSRTTASYRTNFRSVLKKMTKGELKSASKKTEKEKTTPHHP
ncbi:hypothetical protein KIN20_027559 [Parelaphostrongylus tenuis]|uniref:Uncharacterized protein n=1 Tax=Parelaphostrongylus tenuis TaxID=148309 RepID=A0AAD5QZM7_PARTN|nr:hypothetical protein KIN20_027559 [Parelaphostrongylus tenuis]